MLTYSGGVLGDTSVVAGVAMLDGFDAENADTMAGATDQDAVIREQFVSVFAPRNV